MTPDDQSPEEVPAAAGGGTASMTSAEKMIALGALLILLVAYLIGDIFLDEWAPQSLTWAVAMLAVVAILARRFAGWRMPLDYAWVLTFLGYGAGVLGVRELIEDLEEGFIDSSTFIFALSVYVGAALMAAGAFQVSRGSKAGL